MAAAVEEVLGPQICKEKQLSGWINVPADCVRPLKHIHLHSARPPGVNEPTKEGMAGAAEILRIVASLGPDDLVPLPAFGRRIGPAARAGRGNHAGRQTGGHTAAQRGGANIEQLNTVRKQLSRIKGGGLARACRAGRLVSLIISDVPGDPLDLIASGPTVEDQSTPAEALEMLRQFTRSEDEIPPAVVRWLTRAAGFQPASDKGRLETCPT